MAQMSDVADDACAAKALPDTIVDELMPHSPDVVITCEHISRGDGDAFVECTTMAGVRIATSNVPSGQDPYGQWLWSEVSKTTRRDGGPLCLMNAHGEVFWREMPPEVPLDLRNFPMTIEQGTSMQKVQGEKYLSLLITREDQACQPLHDVSLSLEGIRRADLFMRGDWWDDSVHGVKTWGNGDKHGNPRRQPCEIEVIEDPELPSQHRRYRISSRHMTGIKIRWPDGDLTQYYLKDPSKPTEWFVAGEGGPPH